jgi:ribonuclease-3 family protein
VEEGLKNLNGQFLSEENLPAEEYSPLVLAYIGDAVFEVVIRTMVVEEGNRQVNKMHRETIGYVKAGTQAELIRLLLPDLTEEEQAIYRRGRNAKSVTMAKHATMIDYRTATAFEAVIGYLWLKGETERLTDLIRTGIKKRREMQTEGRDNAGST